ncbi:MAG: hypothetical protein ABIB04_00380 [Patescibacteria group bacterium]
MKINIRALLIFAISLLWFSILIPWNGFADPDVFYHAKISELIWHGGPLQAFPWLDLTQFGRNFADLHLGFHLIAAPFVGVFGKFFGLRLISVLLAAGFITIFFLCLRWLKIQYALFWTSLLLLTQPLLVRILLGKASPLALIWYFFGLTATWKRKPWLVALIGFCFALSHGGWVFLAGSIVLLSLGNFLFDKISKNLPWRECLKSIFWVEFLAAIVGALMAWIIHPNFPNTFLLGFTQIVSIGLKTPHNLLIGSEWLPASVTGIIASFAPWIIACILGLTGLLLASKKAIDEKNMRLVASFGFVLAAIFALTLKSKRNVEYLAPVLAVWCAAVWSLVDIRAFYAIVIPMEMGIQSRKGWIPVFTGMTKKKLAIFACIAFGVILLGRQITETWTVFHPVTYPDDVYAETMSAISARALPGDRVFHSNWDEFPMLFAQDDRLRYVSGLDPTFLYAASSTLSDRVRDLTWPMTTSTAEEVWSLIHDDLKSRFVFISKKNHDKFLQLIRSDARYIPLADAKDSAAFMVQE